MNSNLNLSTLLSVLLVAALGFGCSAEPGDRPGHGTVQLRPTRGYILISFDTLRADRLGAYGYSRPTSPTLDRLAASGTLFERAAVQYPSTLTSHMSLFTGVYPQEHRVLPPSTVLAETIATLPEQFQSAGFRTAGHTEGGFVAGGYGFSRGFEDFTDTAYSADTDIERTFERGLEFLRKLPTEDRFFLFLHTYSIHDPYEPPESYRQQFWSDDLPVGADSSGERLRRFNRGDEAINAATVEYFSAMYDASIRYADDVLGQFVADLEALGVLQDTTLVITSDHGEEFLEHGHLAHTQVYPESLWVPLLIVHPEQQVGRRVEQVVETVDIVPTLLELAGLPSLDQVAGRSLVGLMSGAESGPDSSQGYSEVFDVEFVRTLVAQDRGRRYQIMMVEPEWDPAGAWIRDQVTIDHEGEVLQFEAQSFHTGRSIQVDIDGEPSTPLLLTPGWSPVVLELPGGSGVHRITLRADGCVAPADVGGGDDHRCLAFQLRGFDPRRFELYDLVADPLAQRDLFREQTELRAGLKRRLLARQWQPLADATYRPLSKADEQTLKALGYLD